MCHRPLAPAARTAASSCACSEPRGARDPAWVGRRRPLAGPALPGRATPRGMRQLVGQVFGQQFGRRDRPAAPPLAAHCAIAAGCPARRRRPARPCGVGHAGGRRGPTGRQQGLHQRGQVAALAQRWQRHGQAAQVVQQRGVKTGGRQGTACAADPGRVQRHRGVGARRRQLPGLQHLQQQKPCSGRGSSATSASHSATLGLLQFAQQALSVKSSVPCSTRPGHARRLPPPGAWHGAPNGGAAHAPGKPCRCPVSPCTRMGTPWSTTRLSLATRAATCASPVSSASSPGVRRRGRGLGGGRMHRHHGTLRDVTPHRPVKAPHAGSAPARPRCAPAAAWTVGTGNGPPRWPRSRPAATAGRACAMPHPTAAVVPARPGWRPRCAFGGDGQDALHQRADNIHPAVEVRFMAWRKSSPSHWFSIMRADMRTSAMVCGVVAADWSPVTSSTPRMFTQVKNGRGRAGEKVVGVHEVLVAAPPAWALLPSARCQWRWCPGSAPTSSHPAAAPPWPRAKESRHRRRNG